MRNFGCWASGGACSWVRYIPALQGGGGLLMGVAASHGGGAGFITFHTCTWLLLVSIWCLFWCSWRLVLLWFAPIFTPLLVNLTWAVTIWCFSSKLFLLAGYSWRLVRVFLPAGRSLWQVCSNFCWHWHWHDYVLFHNLQQLCIFFPAFLF